MTGLARWRDHRVAALWVMTDDDTRVLHMAIIRHSSKGKHQDGYVKFEGKMCMYSEALLLRGAEENGLSGSQGNVSLRVSLTPSGE